MFRWLKSLFEVKYIPKESLPNTIESASVLDTVWIKDKEELHEGWIFDKTKKSFKIVSGEKEYIFHYKRPLDQTEIKQDNKILYFNKPC